MIFLYIMSLLPWGNFNNSAGKTLVKIYSKLDQNGARPESPGRVAAIQQLNSNYPHYEMSNNLTAQEYR